MISIIKIREITREALRLDRVLSTAVKTVDVAKRAGLNPSTVYTFRNNRDHIKVETLDKLFTYFQKEEPERLKLAALMVKKGLTVDDAIGEI
jgi:predicted transcriptional regulator